MRNQKYFAFISYSRRDKKAAEWLQWKIEHFRYPPRLVPDDRKPEHGKYVRKVFLDKNELEVDRESFKRDIERSLENSRHLILLCSKNSAGSRWVREEVEHFLDAHARDFSLVVPVILDGETPEDIFSGYLGEYREAFESRNLPDMRPSEGEPKKRAWEEGLIKILSYVLGVPHTRIYDRFKAEKARTLRIRTALALLAAASISGVSYLAYRAQKEAEMSREDALAYANKANETRKLAMEKEAEALKAKEEADDAHRRAIKAKEAAKKAKEAEILATEAAEKSKRAADARAREAEEAASRAKEAAEENARRESEEARRKYEDEFVKSRMVAHVSYRKNGDVYIQALANNANTGGDDLTTMVWRIMDHLGHNVPIQKVYEARKRAADGGKSDAEFMRETDAAFGIPWILNRLGEFDAGEFRLAVRRGIPVLAKLRESEALGKIAERTDRRASRENAAEWMGSADGAAVEIPEERGREFYAYIVGCNPQSGEFFARVKNRTLAFRPEELAKLADEFYCPVLVRPEYEKTDAGEGEASAPAGSGLYPAELARLVIKDENGSACLAVNADSFAKNLGLPSEALYGAYSYLGYKPSIDALNTFMASKTFADDERYIENIGKLLGFNWHFKRQPEYLKRQSGFDAGFAEQAVSSGLPTIVSLRHFEDDGPMWEEIFKSRKSPPAHIDPSAIAPLPLASLKLAPGISYAVLCGYDRSQGKYLLNYKGNFCVFSMLEMKFLCDGLYIPYYRKSIQRIKVN